ncbi:glutamate receptor 2.7-like [Iris pallida]|uniref:Glutamate receptor 2.7-like n=1 Tax=Iris pallida TaxID=29817 RepID=A0AAX6DW04_IRIPA|nr:glutamate receptor 2.7-like [Iris pallida]
MAKMPYDVAYKYVPYEDSSGNMNGTYDDLVYQVYLQNFDAVVGDITIIANRSLYVDFTLPYTESGVSMLVPVIDKRHKHAWAFLEPLTPDLWLASGAFIIFTGFVVWVLEHRVNEEFRGTPSNQLGTVFYFSFSTLVFAHREKIVSNLSRIVVIIWVFVVLILQSSYTASLTSRLTVEQLQPTVTDLNELKRDGSSVGYLNDSFMPSFLKRLNFSDSKLIAFQSPEEYHGALSNGTVAAIVDEIPYIKVFLSKFCKKKYITTGPTYKTDGFGFVFPKNSPLVPDVSRAILKLSEAEGNKMTQIEQELYGDGSCLDQGNDSTTSSSLTVKSFSGLFLITGIASVSALSLYLALFLRKHLHILKSDDSGKTVCQKLALLGKAYDKMDTTKKPEEEKEIPAMGDIISGPESPNSSISSYALENFELEDVGTPPDEEVSPGMEISRESPDPPSFADMITQREHSEELMAA